MGFEKDATPSKVPSKSNAIEIDHFDLINIIILQHDRESIDDESDSNSNHTVCYWYHSVAAPYSFTIPWCVGIIIILSHTSTRLTFGTHRDSFL
jgi:hypothetical protein